ncbi:MAG: glycosyltransferase family 4 protein [Chloroflexi bacterium]|nr:glycosyltransferase family 4 protein [Chloroflexota bacterium]
MKILHVVHAYPPSLGGSQTLTAQLAEHLVANYGDDVTVFTSVARNIDYFWGGDSQALPSGIEQMNGVTVRRFPVAKRLNTVRWLLSGVAYRLRLPYNDWLRTWQTGPFMPGLRPAIAQSGAEVIFATAFPLWHMYDAVAAAQQAQIPIVLLGALHLADRWGYDRPMIYQAIRQADAYIAHTRYERDDLIQRQKIPAAKLHVIGAGVAVAPPNNDAGAALRQARGWGAEPVVMMLGKQVARKRFDLLLDAMRTVWTDQPTARLLLAGGRTTYTQTLEQQISRLPPAQQANISLLSDFDEAQKAALLNASDIFVLASGHESFGIAFVEAWAAGKPVIGARSGALASLIDEGIDGLLFDYPHAASLAQAILTLIENPSQRQQMGAAGRHKVLEKFTWEKVTAQVRAVYTEIINRKR